MNNIMLKDIAICQTGPFGSQLHESDYVAIGTPIVTVEHLGEISFTHNNLPFVSEEDTLRLSKYLLKEGDIVFSRVGSVDRNTYVKEAEDGWLFSGRCIRVRIDETKANSKFISFYFRQRFFKEMMLNISVGATMPSLNTSLMDNIPLTVPDLSTQQKIASVLSALDDKIELNNKINAELEAMAKTLYDYWFVQFEFPNAQGKPYKTSGGKMVYNEVLKKEIPEGWEVKKLEELCTLIQSGGTPLTSIKEYYIGEINWFSTQELNDTFNLNSLKNISKVAIESSSAKLFPKDTILIAIYASPTVGRLGILSKEGSFNQACCGLIAKENIGKEFIYYFLLNNRKLLNVLATGTTQKNLGVSTIKNLDILKPNDEIISSFISIVRPILNRKLINLQQNQELSSLRDWLLPMLMNGQVKVREVEEEVLGMVAEPSVSYSKSSQKNDDELFELWLKEEKLAARGNIDRATLRELYDAMDDEDKY